MAQLNPLLKAYPDPVPACSKKVLSIAGIRVVVYGLDEHFSSGAREEVACLWLLHPRLQDQDCMEPLAFSTIYACNSRVAGAGEPKGCGLIAVTFDQRNHGSRQINAVANDDWRSGNETHAQDMFAIYQGTAADTSQLMDYLPAYIFPLENGRISTHIVCGVSLGGHAAWQCLFQEPRISAAISVIGCPDFTRLMYDRARLSKLDSYAKDSFLGSPDFPHSLIRAVEKYDPTAMIIEGSGFSNANDFDTFKFAIDEESLSARLKSKINGKAMLNMSGGEDKLVPYRCSKPFLDWLSANAAPSHRSGDYSFTLKDKLYDGVAHSMSQAMARDLDQFVLERLAATPVSEASITSKM